MGAETQQLADIFIEVSDVFAQHPTITVTPIKGNPPEQYEVHYNIIGVRKDDTGKIQRSSSHVVTITIPFGFPHFPPSCKPKTAVFHPDFDPAAICLGDFWEHDQSLPHLIHYIGKMIGGEIYSKENTFNEEAAIWYRENADKLPFTESFSLDSTNKPEITEPPSLSLAEEIEIDTLEDSDFSSDFNYLEMDHDIRKENKTAESPAAFPSSTSEESDIDLEEIWLLSRQKQFYQLRGIFKDPQSGTGAWFFEGKEDLLERIRTVLAEARQIYIQGDSFEHQGFPGKALEKYIAVEELVSDYPNIHNDIRRAELSKNLLGDWMKGNGENAAKDHLKLPDIDKEARQVRNIEKRSQSKQTDETSQLTFYSEKNKRHFNFVPMVIIGCVLLIASPLLYFYLSLSSQYKEAEALFAQCSNQLHTKQFKDASNSCSASLSLSKDIIFLKKQERIALNRKIESLLSSEELRQGLAGFVLLDGKYVLKSTADLLDISNRIAIEGDKLMSESNLQGAIEVYTKGLNSIQKDTKIDTPYRIELEKKLQLAKTRLLMKTGTEEMAQKAWQEARQNFEQALAESKTLDAEIQQQLSAEIRPQLDKCSFLLLKQQGDKMFANSDWTAAFALFQKAIALGAKLDQSEIQELTTVQEDIIKAELYSTINEGKTAFSNGQWDEAIKKYAKASKILMDHQGLLEQADLDQNRQKLARIMLQTSIIRDQQDAGKYTEQENWSEAEKRIQQVIDAIDQSPVGTEKEFQIILADSKKTVEDLKEKLFVTDKIKYLEDNFRTLFSENYPAASPDTLTSPIVSYIKPIEDKLLFKLQCTEIGRGRPLSLVMFYTYSKSTKKWAFYSNTE